MEHGKYKQFDDEESALVFQNQVAEVINGGPDGDPYMSVPLYDKDLDKYAIKLVWNFEAAIVSIIGQEEYDNAPILVTDGPFYKPEEKEDKKPE